MDGTKKREFVVSPPMPPSFNVEQLYFQKPLPPQGVNIEGGGGHEGENRKFPFFCPAHGPLFRVT